jgi:hypothetical protein
VFIDPLLKRLDVSEKDFLKLKIGDATMANTYQIVNAWAESFRHTVDEYLYTPITALKPSNANLVRKTVSLLEQVYAYQKLNKLWTGDARRNRVEQVFQYMKVIQSRL